MWPFWLLLFGPAYLAITRQAQNQTTFKKVAKNLPGIWQVVFLLLTLMIGLRHEVGGDWRSYFEQIEGLHGSLFSDALTSKDPAYSVLVWLAIQFGAGVYFVNLVCAIFFTSGLIVFCRSQPNPWLALAVAVPYLIVVVAMGYTRQGVAIGIAMLGLIALSQGNNLRFVLWIGLAAAFHKSAIILVPLAVLASTQRRVFTMLWVGLTGFALFLLLLQESVDFLIAGYLEAAYQSSGASIRIAMNAMPALLFLGFRKRFELNSQQSVFWTWMACSALLFVGLLLLSPSSTAVDRVALYWIPLQLFVGSRFPQAMGKRAGTQKQWLLVVLAYTFAVQFVWLFFADHRMLWLPYKFYPWEWLWS
jgi:hypothetical protein